MSVATLIDSLPKNLGNQLSQHVSNKPIKKVTSSSATILGKNYLKQVDVIMTDWATGPELLISTKRMDSSFGKNAPNRIEESYGDAKNLRLRHPLSGLGFLFGLRSTILQQEPKTADWLFDLLTKLGREDDAYHATCVVMMEYGEDVSLIETGEEAPDGILEPGPEDEDDEVLEETGNEIESLVRNLPKVVVRDDLVPPELCTGRFLEVLINHVLTNTPVNMHEHARELRNII
jgi:hypothetical protein